MPGKKRNGIYYWAGPGTIRMTRLKYPTTQIHTASFLNSYNFEVLKPLKEMLQLTDAWVSFSWGFSPRTELEDYDFTLGKLSNFQKLGIKTHAYIQGCNLVLEEHKGLDYFCRDWYGRFIPYHRGRKMTCPNNPYFQELLLNKVEYAAKKDFSGIFVDNILFGQMPLIVAGGYTTFFGCCCTFCKVSFKKYAGTQIPKLFKVDSPVYKQYVQFRVTVITKLLKSIAKQVQAADKEFGTNSFDPRNDTKLLNGTDISDLTQLQDYLLFENHDLPRFGKFPKSNAHLKVLIQKTKKPIFIVSYKKGIGRDEAYNQSDYNAIYTESKKLGYNPCYKGTEFLTGGVWHNINAKTLAPLKTIAISQLSTYKKKSLKGKYLLRLYNRLYNPVITTQFENRYMRKMLGWLYYRALQ